MSKQNSSKAILIASIVIALIMLPILCFALGTNKGINTAWQISPYQNSATGQYYSDSVVLSVDQTVSEIYLYIGNVYNAPNDKIEIVLDSSDSENSIKQGNYFAPNRKTFTVNVKPGEYLGWVKLDLNANVNSKYIKLATKESFELFEVGFVNEKGEKVPAACFGGTVWRNGYHEFLPYEKGGETFALVTDEQSGFTPKTGVNSLSERELKLAGAVDNFINFKGGYVSEWDNVMGVAFASLGVSIFGNSPFGLRIVGFLFFVATLYLLLFFAKKFFNNIFYAILTVVLYLLSGLSLSLVMNSSVISIAIFFLLTAFYFAVGFYNKAVDSKSVRAHSNSLIICGFMFSLAFCTSIHSLFALPALLIVCLVPSIKAIKSDYKAYKQAEGLEKEYSREKYRKTLFKVISNGVIGFIIAPIFLTVITYGIVYPSYSQFYADSNFFEIIFKNMSRLFNAPAKGVFAEWIIAMGSASSENAFGATSVIVANRIFVALSAVSIVVIGILYILNKFNKISNGALVVALKENAGAYLAIVSAFLSTWLLNIFFVGANDYATFAISTVFLVLSLTLSHKFLAASVSKKALNAITICAIGVICLLFVLQVPLFFHFDLPKDFRFIYEWLK